MEEYRDKWHLTFSDSPSMNLNFGVDVRPVISQGTTNYSDLENKPSINGVLLIGDKSNEELNITSLSNTEIEELLKAFV